MSEQATFRVVFGVAFLVMGTIVGRYRRRAQAGRRIDYSGEGGSIFLALRLGGLAVLVYCLLFIAYPWPLTPTLFDLPVPLRWSGAGIVLLLIPFVVASQRALGRNVSPTVMTHEDHQLVTHGPYRWIRNPLYVAGSGLFTGLGLIAASWFLIGGAALAFTLAWWRLPAEEAELEARFGQAYRDYVARTGRFLPRLFR